MNLDGTMAELSLEEVVRFWGEIGQCMAVSPDVVGAHLSKGYSLVCFFIRYTVFHFVSLYTFSRRVMHSYPAHRFTTECHRKLRLAKIVCLGGIIYIKL